jgi:hypothetical protein
MATVVDFPGREEIGHIHGIPVKNPRTELEYLALCKRFLTIEDYEEVLLCIMDDEYYGEAEPQIQEIVKTYFSYY